MSPAPIQTTIQTTIQICPLCQTTYTGEALEFCHEDGARLRSMGQRWLGRVLGQRYEVLRFLGAGGMAEVYEARRTDDNQRVALKLLRPQISDDASLVERFRREAQMISLIDHPNVVAVHDTGTFDDGTVYIAMELLQGQPLDEVLEGGPLADMVLALDVACQACEGLQAAHDKGIVHRDVKPANIYLQETAAGETEVKVVVKVLDLGIAKLQGDRASNLTATGMVFGSPEYISPEQALGKPVDTRADIYSLGVVLYHVFTGLVPFSADSFVGILTKHASATPLWPERVAEERGLPRSLGDVIMKALEKNPEHRYQTMLELRDALTTALADSSRSAKPQGSPTAVIQPGRTTKRLVSLEEAGAQPDNEVVEIAEGTYWVGRREGVVLERNVFLRVYRGAGHQLNVIIDPGPTKDLNTVAAKVKKVVGPLENIVLIFLNH
ncbi:MAG: serine/threonine protein kinase, partial [Deltaproteobacteria bacterium]|nr:serine/threonine protein kinase [Deltaproteobacteria bacterium]